MMKYMERGDFYEDDEPIEEIIAAFNAGEKFLTAHPVENRRGWTSFLRLGDADPVTTYPAPGARARLA